MEYRILGPLEALREDRAIDLGGRKQRALLVLLLLHANEVVHAERLIEELWAGEPPESAAKSLQVYVSRLRKQLGNGAVTTRAGGYVLAVADGELDLDRFRAGLDRGRRALALGDAAAADETLGQALTLWRGPPLADFRYDSFAQAEISQLDELPLAALEDRFEAKLALGRHRELVSELERLVADHPLRERLRGQLMLALYRCGRPAEALASYQDARRALAEELGIDPGRPLQELERAVLNQEPALDPPLVDAAASDAAERSTRPAAALFVGREREFGELEGALGEARAGRGQLVILAGEAGIGKSRLAEQVAGRARSLRMRVLWGRCWEAGGAPAYWPWVHALRAYLREADADVLREQLGHGGTHVAQLLPELRELFPDLPEPALNETEADRFRLFDSTAAFLRRIADERPLLVVLDDVHAADASSLLLLEFVAAELADAKIFVLAAYRDPELEPGHPTAAALAAISRRATARLTLAGLRKAEVASYIAQSTHVEPSERLVTAIADETEGNPLFVGEIVRLLAADGRLASPEGAAWRPAIPETVKEVIGRRLKRLSEGCVDVLALASVVGREFPLDLLEHLSGRPRDDVLSIIDEAIVARLVTDVPGSPGRMRFTHALVRDTLYDNLAPARRRDLHRQAGEAIEAIAGTDPTARLSELAHHFYRALPSVEPMVSVEYARRAGDLAGVLLAHEEAARLYETALGSLALASQPDRDVERRLLLSLGDSLARSGDMPRAQDAFLRAAANARAAQAAEDLAAGALGYGGRIVWGRAAGDTLVVSLLEEALDTLGETATPLRARLLARLAGALRDERDRSRRLEVATLAVETARSTGDPAALAYALAGLCAARHGLRDVATQLAATAELRELALRTNDREAECEALMAEVLVYFDEGDTHAVRDRAARIAALADELRQPPHQWFALAVQAMRPPELARGSRTHKSSSPRSSTDAVTTKERQPSRGRPLQPRPTSA